MENRLADKKAQGIPSYGTFTQLKSAAAVENIACAPFDFVVIDTEHQTFGTDLMTSAVASAQGAGLTPLVRICEISRRAVLHPLDAGAAGLIVPAVKTAEEVRQLVTYAKFAPLGNRGYQPTRDCRWGSSPSFTPVSYMEEANRKTLLIPQCETRECLEHIEEIASIDGLEYFPNLESVNFYGSRLLSADFSICPALKSLDVGNSVGLSTLVLPATLEHLNITS